MRYIIDSESADSAYLQLYKQIREDITSGIYRYGEKLPSKRMLAEETGCSLITAEHSLSLLLEEGYIESRQRSGYFVIFSDRDVMPVGESTRQPSGTEQILPKPDAFPFSVLAGTMRHVISQYGERLLVKSPSSGIPELREQLAKYLARSRGIVVSPEQIVIGSGAEYLYGLIVQILGRESYALEDPSYEQIRKVYEANGASCEMLKMGSDGIFSSELERSRSKILHITPFHSYPSGVTATASKRAEYVKWALDRNGTIIEDDVDSEFSMSTKIRDTVFSLEPERSVIYTNTFSRTIAPSMRAGYMVLPSAMSEAYHEKIDFYSCSVPVFEQYVLAEFIGSGDFERHINRVRRSRRKRGQLQ